jgi:hypothetical protein
MQRKHRLKVNVPANWQAKPAQIKGYIEKTVTAFFALNCYFNIQGLGSKI